MDIGLTVIVPTIGREHLSRTLRSIRDQRLTDRDEILVVGDTLDGPLPEVERLAALAGDPFRYVPHAGDRHWYGFPQINHAIRLARPGNYLLTLPDDDVLTAGALDQVRRAITPDRPRPLMFRFLSPMGWVVPDREEVAQANVSNQCFVVPNLPGRVADLRYERYESDYDWIVETLARWPEGSLVWCAPLLVHARPKPGLYPDLETGPRTRLVIGAGGLRPPGDWTTVDTDPATHPDVCADGRTLLLFGDGSIAEIYAGHVLEHLDWDEGQAALAEWRRVLKPGGTLTVIVPDFREICRRYLAGDGTIVEWPQGTRRIARDLHLINRMFLYSYDQPSRHRWCYDGPHLREALELAGFEIVSEVDRYHDPLVAVGAYYQTGWRAVKP